MIENKKDKYIADVAIPPGETLLEMLDTNNMTQAELAKRIGFSRKHINKIIKGDAPITAKTAVKLENIFSLPASFWTNLEANYREALARIESEKQDKDEKKIAQVLPYNEMAKKGWVAKTYKINEKIKNLRIFFRVSNLTLLLETETYNVAFRTAQSDQASSLALAAWLEKGHFLANEIDAKSFSEKKLKSLITEFRKMTRENPEKFSSQLIDKLSECGIAFVLVPHLQKTYAHGAVKWVSKDKAMIQLSLRYQYSDIFWFTFFHEIGHILLHGKREHYVEFEERKNDLQYENEADEYAANTLIPKKDYKEFIQKGNFDEFSIRSFAKRLEIDPGIVVGRLQHDNIIEYYIHSELRKKYNYKQFLN